MKTALPSDIAAGNRLPPVAAAAQLAAINRPQFADVRPAGVMARRRLRRVVDARSTSRVGSTVGSLARERAPLMMASRL
jgi:hypothetical protein